MADKKKKKVSASRLSGLIEDIKVEHDVPVLERIRFPIIWERIPSGYRIQDLQPSKIDHAIDIIKDYYIEEEALCRGVDLTSDTEAVDEYLSLVSHWLKDTQSLAAVEEGTGSIVGLLIGRALDRTVMIQSRMVNLNSATDDIVNISPLQECPAPACDEASSRPTTTSKKQKTPKSKDSNKTTETKETDVNKYTKLKSFNKSFRASKFPIPSEARERIGVLGKNLTPMFDDEFTTVQNPKLLSIHRLKSYLTKKVDILNLYDVDMYYSLYVLLVVPQHRGKGVAKALIRSAMEMAEKFGCDVVAGIFTSKISQNIVYKEGFMILEEMRLSDWLVDGEEVFTEIDDNEITVAVMAHRMEIPEPPPPPPPLHAPRRSKMDKATKK